MSVQSISRRQFLKRSGAGLAAISTSTLLNRCGSSSAKPPNLVFVFPDQMRAQTLGFMGQEPTITPHLDNFARESVVFSEAVSNYPVCSPYRGMLFSGQWSHTNGVIGNCTSKVADLKCELSESTECWSDVLKTSGYDLGYFGKWHLDCPRPPYIPCRNNEGETKWNEWCPPSRRHGFDFWYAYGTYDDHMRPMYWSTDAGRDEFQYVDDWGPRHEADRAIAYIENRGETYRDNDNPFALVVSMNPPHMPYPLVPQEYVEMYRHISMNEMCRHPGIPPAGTRWGEYYRKHIRNYLAMVTGVDEQFGRILQVLETQGLSDNTIVVFTSDHGNCLGIHNQISKNNYYEESMRIPLMIRWPGQIRPRNDDLLISVPDMAPTLLDLMGLSERIPSAMEGFSHAPLLLSGEGSRPDSQLYLHVNPRQPELGRRGVRTKENTFVIERSKEGETVILFDRINDPYQLNNIAESQPHLVKDFKERSLQLWLEKTNDPWVL